MLEAPGSYVKSAYFYQIARRHISEDNSFYSYHLEDTKSYLDCDDFLMSRD